METYFKNMTVEEGTKEKLFHDMKILLQDGQTLVVAAGGNLAQKSKEELKELAERLKVVCGRIKEQSAQCAKATDQAIRAHPYRSLMIAFGVGVVAGVLLQRKYRKD
jgi:ElaB/YqjD/DUF883 family membrane-anchored ribosome-binding protein